MPNADLNRIRLAEGIKTRGPAGAATPGSSAALNLRAVRAVAQPARTDASDLMPFMAVVAVLAGVAAFLMRPFYRWANAMSMPGHTGHFVFGWLRAILSFWSIQTWLPIVAVCAAGILLVLWVVLLVDSEATMVVVTLSSIALAAGSLGCLPFLIALAVGIACAVIYALVMIVIGIVVMLLLGAILWGLMNQ